MLLPKVSPDTIRKLERYEMTCWRTWFLAPGPALVDGLGIKFTNVCGAQVAIAAKLDFILFNRVLGLGNEEPCSPAIVDRIIQAYVAAGVPRFFMQVSPAAEPKLLPDWLRQRGFKPSEPWAKLHRTIPPAPSEEIAARIEPIAPSDSASAAAFGRIVQAAFEYPPETAAWFAALVPLARWRTYLAYSGDRPVGAGALFINGDWASMEIGVVLPEARHKGIHGALIARRMRDADAAGCRYLSMETSAEIGDSRAQAFRNARRQGFELAYFRENWEWTRPDATAGGGKPAFL